MRTRMIICILLFTLMCVSSILFLSLFTRDENPILGFVQWDTRELVDARGNVRTFSADTPAPWGWQEGETVRLSGVLPDLASGRDIYEDRGYMAVICLGSDVTVLVDGVEYAHVRCPDRGQMPETCQLLLPLTASDAGKTVTISFVPLSPEYAQFPVLSRYSSENAVYRSTNSTATRSALPAGAYTLGFLIICAVFLIGLAMGNPDWTLIILALVAFASMAQRLSGISGYYFLPEKLYQALSAPGFPVLLIALLMLYLVLNRRLSFWRYLGRITAWTVPIAVILYSVDRLRGGRLHLSVDLVIRNMADGFFYQPIQYLCVYLTSVCGCIAAYRLFRWILDGQNRASTLALRNELITESYENIRRSMAGTAVMRHEWKNRVTAIHVLARKGDAKALEQAISELDDQITSLSPEQYSECFAVNLVLQNAAARAEASKVAFHASAPLPRDLSIPE